KSSQSLLVVLALNTGARQGELLQLRYEDMDLERDLIYFGKTKNRKLKTIPMNKAVKEALEWLLKHRYSEYLFSWPWGEQIGRTTIYDAFEKACSEAKIEQMRFHDLRHTAASYLVMGGVDLPRGKRDIGTSRDRDDFEVFSPSASAQSEGRGEARRGFEQYGSEPREPRTGGARTSRFGRELGTKQEHFACKEWA